MPLKKLYRKSILLVTTAIMAVAFGYGFFQMMKSENSFFKVMGVCSALASALEVYKFVRICKIEK